jgi:hypothetical protein
MSVNAHQTGIDEWRWLARFVIHLTAGDKSRAENSGTTWRGSGDEMLQISGSRDVSGAYHHRSIHTMEEG